MTLAKSFAPNSPERIVFCIDLDENVAPSSVRQSLPRLELVKQAVSVFVHTKAAISNLHSYAICALVESALWYLDFTTDADVFLESLSALEMSGTFATFDLNSLYSILAEKLVQAEKDGCILRSILLYTRSSVVPTCSAAANRLALTTSQRFFYDVVYLHDAASATNRVQEVFDVLVEFEHSKNESYLFENCTNLRRFYYNVALLVAHPLQRPTQDEFKSSLGTDEVSDGA